MTIGTPEALLAQKRVEHHLLSAGFREYAGGIFYPPGSTDRALVCFSVYDGQYQLRRRRKPGSPWMVIAAYDAADFSLDAFRSWLATWPLVAD